MANGSASAINKLIIFKKHHHILHLEVPTVVASNTHLNSNAKLVFGLIYTMFIEGHSFFMKNGTINSSLGISQPTISRSINRLSEQNWIKHDNSGSNNVRHITSINFLKACGITNSKIFFNSKEARHAAKVLFRKRLSGNSHKMNRQPSQNDNANSTKRLSSLVNMTRPYSQNDKHMSQSTISLSPSSLSSMSQSSSSRDQDDDDARNNNLRKLMKEIVNSGICSRDSTEFHNIYRKAQHNTKRIKSALYIYRNNYLNNGEPITKPLNLFLTLVKSPTTERNAKIRSKQHQNQASSDYPEQASDDTGNVSLSKQIANAIHNHREGFSGSPNSWERKIACLIYTADNTYKNKYGIDSVNNINHNKESYQNCLEQTANHLNKQSSRYTYSEREVTDGKKFSKIL